MWLFQSGDAVTVGASGLIFGYFGYVLVRGFLDRNMVDIGVGVVAGVLYWTILQVAIPGTPGVSWIGHLGGLVGGVIAAWVVRSRTPVDARPRPAMPGASNGQADEHRRPAARARRQAPVKQQTRRVPGRPRSAPGHAQSLLRRPAG